MKNLHRPFTLLIGAIALIVGSCTVPETNNPSIVAQPTTSEIATNKKLTPKSFKQVTVAKDLERPWGMAWLPDGAILITERVGRVKIFRNGSLEQIAIAEIPNLFVSGQAGLMDISLHPRFAQNNLVYLTYSSGNSQSNHTSILRAKFDGKALVEPQVIFEVKPSKSGNQHFGSRIVWLPDDTMLIAIGDGGNPPLQLDGELIRNQAQKLNSQLGKVLRLKDDGSIPSDNPFVKTASANPAIWSYGHRNIQGLFADPISKQVWSTEHGSRGGDELNLIEAEKNYGWPVVTFSQEYTGGKISKEVSRPNMVDPKLVWTPAIAPSGLLLYRGNIFPNWEGNLFAGGLVSKSIVRIKIEGNKTIVQETIPVGQRVRDVRQGKDGFIYILTDEQAGQLIRLEPM
ncbi:MAG: PQQ-dependent sugar dehydrogenase [Pseudanabaena sp. M135S2SP2A07QC]|nr:PQQ-dependent sugar dehydrogenase [Pseudanabaena sp. M090S1SP2A07QC]MCA6504862.1 PQQ-dependent sugar dehydrogenase [Pseudanabaena sp. M172S2SP2A07QC]MCA6523849.1 PQQ-dependent sugar dehydrogenase [Pseudanabaena sp. M051S1SP2A07QC]MCA6528041.1 PQQ-dependent sugar dehydrogenase [Pseudanabaena sp. M179S2SP2A07QC]MCA6531375.1 PQQ-dependent sugar dehydrogenase [Pseudanabaena sp. M125S2SP2A07QC]MCA6536966.1 PQQ-dependent sugar dehydrogenase [Pseudanabaena sp. M176S2SP2A07QC]MCA6541519.1 PQQ-depe